MSNNLTRIDPFSEMLSLRNAMDRLFDDFFAPSSAWDGHDAWSLALDVSESNDAYTVKAAIPGINPDEIEVTFTGNTLTIKGETKAEEEKEDQHYHLRERRYGSFTRSLTLPGKVEGDKINAAYEAGVLTLTLPKAEVAKPKRIAIQMPKLLEGKARSK